MIEFQNKLPAMWVNGKQNGTYNNKELGFPSILTATDCKLGMFLRALRQSIFSDRSLVSIDGKILVVAPYWIRDHVHVMKATRHWEDELQSFLNFILQTQHVGLGGVDERGRRWLGGYLRRRRKLRRNFLLPQIPRHALHRASVYHGLLGFG